MSRSSSRKSAGEREETRFFFTSFRYLSCGVSLSSLQVSIAGFLFCSPLPFSIALSHRRNGGKGVGIGERGREREGWTGEGMDNYGAEGEPKGSIAEREQEMELEREGRFRWISECGVENRRLLGIIWIGICVTPLLLLLLFG